ncbi:MAG: hypothetical protein HC912_03630 [Saprospiraceae bacterium]|nr:hypothetical protein [Saprospiraceae bacterium]
MLQITSQSDWTNLHQNVLLPIHAKTLANDEWATFCEKYLNLSITRLREDFKGEKNEVHLMYRKEQKIFLLGLGDTQNSLQLIKILRSFLQQICPKIFLCTSTGLFLSGIRFVYRICSEWFVSWALTKLANSNPRK